MKHLRTRELEPTSKPKDRGSLPHRIAAATKSPDLVATIILCAVVCLIALNLILYFPDLGLTVEQFNPFAGP
jgi:hypothetical protein